MELAATTGLAVVSAATASAAPGGVTVTHAFGSTHIAAPPRRVVSAGFTEQDDLLALGVVPVATTEWFGNQPYAVWPWAQPRLGGAQPTVLSLANGIQIDRIAALKPDLIVAANAGVDATSYQRLSAIAPTIPQSGAVPFFESWKQQSTAIAQAVFRPEAMKSQIEAIDAAFTNVARTFPQFQGKSIASLQGSTRWQDSAIATRAGWKTEWLTQMGFVIPATLDAFGHADDDRAYIPLDQIDAALGGVDVLLWRTEGDADIAALQAIPAVAAFGNRNVFTTREQSGAIAFTSPLSFPLVADQLPPLLARAVS
ncbi:iron ABC transporter substrate-binding protein [Mycobacterium sp. EPa45]|nr:iron ABC transporter substrate-binding protein [Mycobacterium sp. EPa45]